ncbi:MAG: hypothetical protein MI865_00805 [Proteobacteria bacterium]|nr:hypothetical protein [Pseudomonadota bacterium]
MLYSHLLQRPHLRKTWDSGLTINKSGLLAAIAAATAVVIAAATIAVTTAAAMVVAAAAESPADS